MSIREARKKGLAAKCVYCGREFSHANSLSSHLPHCPKRVRQIRIELPVGTFIGTGRLTNKEYWALFEIAHKVSEHGNVGWQMIGGILGYLQVLGRVWSFTYEPARATAPAPAPPATVPAPAHEEG
jgi:hypothetical protein